MSSLLFNTTLFSVACFVFCSNYLLEFKVEVDVNELSVKNEIMLPINTVICCNLILGECVPLLHNILS